MSQKYRDEFCVMILSHGRPNNQDTVKTLNKYGYTGEWFIVLDNEDPTIDQYIANFGEDKIKVFDKEAVMNE